MEAFTIGVEEEFFVVDAETYDLRPRAELILEAAKAALGDHVLLELQLAQIETTTAVCFSLGDVRAELTRLRSGLIAAAEQHGSSVIASGTHPFARWLGQQITPKERYVELDKAYQRLAWDQLICGLHVHVGIANPELAIRVMDRTRPWLPTIRALAVNSPFWEGLDTGYASFRTLLFDRWPNTGPAPVLGARAHYDALVAELVAIDAVEDASKIYWDVRPSTQLPTLEFRVGDVCLSVAEAVLIAALCRSLARTCHAEVVAGRAIEPLAPELVHAARWHAARYGLEATLVDLEARRSLPARAVVEALLRHLEPDLREHGEWDEVTATTDVILDRGTGAQRQRDFADGLDLRGLVEALVEATADGIAP